MPVTYTNRKGYTYYLCQGLTKKGNPRYFFSRTPKDTVLEEIPEGYEIRESVNGNVSLAKAKPIELLDDEISAVRSALKKHPKAGQYREDIKPRQITVYESMEPDADSFMSLLSDIPGSEKDKRQMARQLAEKQQTSGQFSPVLRFILLDTENRLFEAQRMCYRGGIDDWIEVEMGKPIQDLASRLIPTLGTDAFFELY